MIKSISKIKGLGVYENYTKPAGTQEFVLKNLIYGWNYTGKTTLSRLFGQLECRMPNPDITGCSFSFETDGEPITEANFTQTNLSVRVFNEDFVRDNINFTGKSFNPILLLGKESEEAQKKLDHCEELAHRTQQKISLLAKEESYLNSTFSSAKTLTAAKIKKTLGLVQAYTATHLASDISNILNLKKSALLPEDKLRDYLKLALTPESERPDTVDRIDVSASVAPLHKEAVEVLATTPSLTSTIKHLEENPLIEKWVEKGLLLHSEKDKCGFCGGDVNEHRLAELKAHFSQDLADHKSKVEQLYNRVKAASLSIQPPKETELNPQFRDKFREATTPLPKAIDAFNLEVDTLAADVQKKIEAPFKAQTPKKMTEGLAQVITNLLKEVNQIIDDNNEIASNFTNAKQEAIKRVKLHYVQEFVDEQEKVGREAKINSLKAKQERLNRFATTVQGEADELRAIISQAQLGREEINQRLSSMLGDEAVQIKVVSDGDQERFQLVRKNGVQAKNLSAGEKTAIAFSYFLTKL